MPDFTRARQKTLSARLPNSPQIARLCSPANYDAMLGECSFAELIVITAGFPIQPLTFCLATAVSHAGVRQDTPENVKRQVAQ